MSLLRTILAGLAALLRPNRDRRQLDEELASYLDEATAALIAAGADPDTARRQARLALGNPQGLREDVRASGWEHGIETFARDIRLGVRLARRQPAFAATVILTLALGIGGNTAILMLVNTVYFAPLPIEEPDRVVRLLDSSVGADGTRRTFTMSPVNAAELLRESPLFSAVVATSARSLTVTGDDRPERVRVVSRTSGWTATLGVRPVLGRDFTAAEEALGDGSGVAIVADGLWRERFPASHPGAATLRLDGRPYTVVGVMPPGFRFPYDADVWLPLTLGADAAPRGFAVFGRLREGVTDAQLTAALDLTSSNLRAAHPDQPPHYAVVAWPLRRNLVENQAETLLVLLSVVGFLLLLACANVATLLVARGVARRREIVIRAVLGAGRARLLSGMLAESLVLAAAGGLLGVLLAHWLSPLTAVLIPSNIGAQLGLAQPIFDWRVLACTVALTTGAALIVALVPAAGGLHGAAGPLDAGGRSASGRRAGSNRLLEALVLGETAIAIVLLGATGIMVQHLHHLQQRDLGIRTSGLFTATLSPSRSAHPSIADRARLAVQIEEAVGAVPGVRAAGLTTVNPLGGASWTAPVVREGSDEGDAVQVHHRLVTPSVFEAMGIPLVGGRLFSPDDDARRPFVVLVSAALAHRLWGDARVVGKRVRLAVPDAPWFTVVGIVGNVQDSQEADAPAETWYLPLAQHAGSPAADELHLMVRAADGFPPASSAIRSALTGIDRTLAATDLTSMNEYYAGAIERERFGAGAVTSFGLFGLVLAALGVYAVMAFAVAERRPEIGVRIALGATRGGIVRLLVGRGIRLGVAGVLVGTAAAHGVVRLIEAAMPGVRASEALALAAASLLLLVVLLLACYLPARRAARTDPLLALREE